MTIACNDDSTHLITKRTCTRDKRQTTIHEIYE